MKFYSCILFSLLFISCVVFGLDLLHMIYHLAADPTLWKIHGVPSKLFFKIVFFLTPVSLRVFLKNGIRLSPVLIFVFCFPLPARAASGCQQAHELLDKSGIARDAEEGLLGGLKLKPPYGSFPIDIDKVTWWGNFKPFEFWESPQFQAVWLDPQGHEIGRKKFRGSHCSLAKATLFADQQPQGEFQEGMWNVIVTCDDYLIDKKSFAVLGTGAPPKNQPNAENQNQNAPQGGMMIWAKDALKDK